VGCSLSVRYAYISVLVGCDISLLLRYMVVTIGKKLSSLVQLYIVVWQIPYNGAFARRQRMLSSQVDTRIGKASNNPNATGDFNPGPAP
jgi:hypothetical protein